MKMGLGPKLFWNTRKCKKNKKLTCISQCDGSTVTNNLVLSHVSEQQNFVDRLTNWLTNKLDNQFAVKMVRFKTKNKIINPLTTNVLII